MNQKNSERDRLREKLVSNEAELEQLQHQQQRLENRIAYYEKADRKKRTHRLCTIAGTMESIAPGLRELTTPEVIELLEQVFELPDVRVAVHNAVLLHREKEENASGPVPPERQAD